MLGLLRAVGFGGAHFLTALAEEALLGTNAVVVAVLLLADSAAAAGAATGLGGTTGGANLEPQNLQNLALSFCSTPAPSLQSHTLAVATASVAVVLAVTVAAGALVGSAGLLLAAAVVGNFRLQNLQNLAHSGQRPQFQREEEQ